MNNIPHSTAVLLPALSSGKTWIPVRNGESGDLVFRRSDDIAYAKVATGDRCHHLEAEYQRVQWLAGARIGSPEVLDWIVQAEGSCLVMSAVPGVPASELDADTLLKAWPAIARQISLLHALPVADCPFDRSLPHMFHRAQDVVARGAVNPDFLDPDQQEVPPIQLLQAVQAQLPEMLAREVADKVICHGDACMPNLMIDPDTLACTGIIDLGRLGVADRYVDYALLLGNTREIWRTTEEAAAAAAILFDVLHIPEPDQERLNFYLRLDPLTWG